MRIRYNPEARPELAAWEYYIDEPEKLRGHWAEQFARRQPMVLDADGLNALEDCPERLDDRRGRVTILTPHDGEFARLTGKTLAEIASGERSELASRFACEHACILVLKGHRTRIALPDGRMLVNTSGSSALAKGGSGDVLTGVIAALLCQDAAALGVWLHGRAGELLEQELTAYCVSPDALAERGLPAAFREIMEL